MPKLFDLFKKEGITLYQNESLDLDHYYQEPYQDNNPDNNSDEFQMDEPFETIKIKKNQLIKDVEDIDISHFAFFMDGSRRTYKIGDIVINNKTILPVVVAQVRAGSTERNEKRKLHKHEIIKKNLILITDRMNDSDFEDLKMRINRTTLAKNMFLEVVKYRFDKNRDIVPVNSAIACANNIMHGMEIDILRKLVDSDVLKTGKMLIVDGPLQFLYQDNRKPEFADLFYNVIGVSKSFDPMLPTSNRTKRGGTQIGALLLKLKYCERTPVFKKTNSMGRVFGCWYLRIRPNKYMHNPLEGIIKVEKMTNADDVEDGLDSVSVDNLSRSLLKECAPTCHGKDERWASHLYPVYLTERMIKSSFYSDLMFINQFRKDFK